MYTTVKALQKLHPDLVETLGKFLGIAFILSISVTEFNVRKISIEPIVKSKIAVANQLPRGKKIRKLGRMGSNFVLKLEIGNETNNTVSS